MTTRWAVEWHSRNSLMGEQRHILWANCLPLLFCTRTEARQHIQKEYGYIKTRKDLRSEPHGWRLPKAVRVEVILRKCK